MNYKTMADIFKGLTQVGAWGCFDEFNRIQIEVLSVIATQVKTIQDYIKRYANPMNRETEYQRLPAGLPPVKVGEFLFEGDVISLIPSCGFFITMNPGYAGRTELPENLKALFRSCAMIRPDLEPICENMLMSEGFQTAKTLAVKFVTLYGLSSELLSKQFHYDWGLRAVKSVLRVAGMLKRGEPELDEAQILMRALRDFNLPKIPNIDEPIFRRLISDLFMGIDVSVKLDESLRDKVTSVANQRKLQDDAGFVLKVLQFQELLDVRHSVMILGPAGCGKTTIWKTLSDAHNWEHDKQAFKSKKTCVYETVNPKAVTGNELYGYMTLAKDWKDGVISIIMRGMSKNFSEQGFHDYQTYKWVVLDGDIDAEWIESMNTVMDDNKVLTLVSNERVPLSDAMRMIFEISSLKNATPATVSRAGILYVNETDIGWKPFVDSWIEKREEARKEDASLYPDPLEGERTYLPVFFDKYIEAASDMIRKDFKEVTPIRLINRVTTIVHLLEAILNDLPGEKKTMEILENIFVYCLVWAFGGPMIQDKLVDYRQRFNDMFAVTFGSQFPKEKTCFDYYFDVDAQAFVDWSERVPEYTPLNIGSKPDETQFSDVYVSTTDSVRMTYLIDLLAKNGKFAMLVGGAGTGKTAIIQQYLSSLDKDADGLLSSYITMSYFTDSAKLQGELELPIDKRSGRRFGPPASKRLIFFLDDLNLPYVETYGTQNAIALLTQHMQYGTIFDRLDLGFRKEIVDVQYLAAMNPTAGSFEICERCQRHFSTFACLMPSDGDLSIIFQSVLQGHLLGYPDSMVQEIETIVSASVQLHTKVSKKFLPSAVKFTYNWNMRELAGIFEGLTKTTMQYYDSPIGLKRLWMHEAYRVFTDRMFSLPEIEDFEVLLKDVIKSTLNISNMDEFMGTKPLFTNFATTNDGAYLDIPDFPTLKSVIETKLNEYNESNAMMDLVLFEDAIEHVTRISRILSSPGGNAMLIGVGGSGKQSLSRLASFISGFEVRQLPITSSYKMEDLQEALQELFKQAGVKGQSIVWLLTDSQIVNEKFLVYINSILATGWISDLFAKEDLDGMLGAIRNEAKAANVPDHPDALLEFFIRRLKVNFHIILCFSPVGETFRVRARRFPGLINCTTIDFFHPWPKEALISVAHRFIDEVELEDGELKEKLAMHMAEEHLSVTTASIRLYETQRRYNYTTPKSFLELISFYKYLLEKKRNDFMKLIDRLDVGLSTLRKTAADVSELQEDLKHTMEKVEEKKVMTDALIEEMGVQRQDAEVQQEAANIEAEKASKAAYEASLIEQEAEQELSEAEPAMREAAKAVDVLSKSMLTELKSLPNPPSGVDKVTNACLILVEHEFRQLTWDRAKKMMANVDQFKNRLRDIRGEDITDDIIERLRPYMEDAEFDPSFMLSKSAAAANLCSWCVNIYRYNRIYVKVKFLMDRLYEAQDSKATAEASLKAAQDNVAEVQAKLEALQQSFMEATEEKAKVEAEAERCLNRLALAERLVNGLSSENERWGNEIEKLRESAHTLVGDCMLASGFVSYIGAFDQQFRRTLWQETWLPDLIERGIPTTEGVNVLTMLTNDGHTAKMIADGLPSDSISVENGAIISNCKRWPLIIDPQQQGIKWLRRKGEREGQLEVIQLNQKNWQRTLVNAMTNGTTIIIENLGEEITATMEPVLSRAFYKKGRSLFLQFGGEEVEYDPKFQLYLQTKYSNPHYKPEIAAQCTLINFIATEKGLEDQLLAKVVGVERPELEREMQELQAAFQQYKIQLVELEDDILERLANAPDDILSDVPLIESLEATKKAANEITKAVEQGKITEIEINKARESFRPQATEGAMLYFLLTKLSAIDHMYQYSLDSFVSFFFKSIEKAKQPSESSNDPTTERVLLLRESLRMTIYTWISRGLFERHKLTFLAQITFNLMKRGILGDDNIPDEVEFQFLLRGTKKTGEANVLSWLPDSAWDACQALSELEEFGKFSSDLVEASSRFQEWFNLLAPEDEKLPLDWSGLDRTPFKKMLVVRCLRPDRMTNSLSTFIRTVLPNGHDYVECDASMSSVDIIDQSLNDSGPETPIYFILSPGSNVLGDLDVLAGKYGYVSGQSYHNISMGQGQDIIAMRTLENAHRNGHWVILNNIHLMPSWLEELEKKLDEFALEGSHERFKLYLSSEPANSIPIGILNRSIKLTNEPPTGLKANLKRAFASFSKEQFDEYDSKTKSILFGLCHFHSIMLERKMYGPLGYNMMYPFGVGDLRDSSVVLNNYMEQSGGGKIPWQDLRYIFGEIMYGGHIVNDFDRLMANTYLEWFMRDELLDEMELYPFAEDEKGVSFMTPLPTSYDRYLEYIDQAMGSDTPIAFGLHPNAEIEFRTTMSDNTFRTLMELQPRDASSGEGTMSPEQIAETALQDILERFGDKKFDVEELMRSLDDQGPYQNVFLQEMDIMNVLLDEIIRSLNELQLGFSGELTMSEAMETLKIALFMDQVPETWAKKAWPSRRGLSSWLSNFGFRLQQLDQWQNNPLDIPRTTWISGFVNPQSFLTAICQVTAKSKSWELDKLVTETEVTKEMDPGNMSNHSKDGAYIFGVAMQGARWDLQSGFVDKSRPKEMFCPMPVINVKAVASDKADRKGIYECPVYKTEQRGPTFVFLAQLKTKSPSQRWVLAGVALIMDIV
jgi:dynein heavy chain